ncbi:MAG: hypothetical protein ACLP0J_14755, partial [Solirubrobacteraceae bacterium]
MEDAEPGRRRPDLERILRGFDWPEVGSVDWWQRERSELIARDLLPFNHGERIYRRWGDQV